jgi:Flp pilus assembly protein TadD
MYKQQGDRALADAHQAVRFGPRSVAAYKLRAIAHGGAGDRRGAIADLRKVLELAPADEQARTMLRDLGDQP